MEQRVCDVTWDDMRRRVAEGWRWRPTTEHSGLPGVHLVDTPTGAEWRMLVPPGERRLEQASYEAPPQKEGHEWRVFSGQPIARCPWCGTWGPEDWMVKTSRQRGWFPVVYDPRPKTRLGARIGRFSGLRSTMIPNIESAPVCLDCSLGHFHEQVGLARAGKPRLVKKEGV